MKNVIIGYKWNQNRTEEDWLFWLKSKLSSQGFNVTISKIDQWPSKSLQWIKEIQKNYSIEEHNIHVVPKDPGCLSLLLYIERLASTPSIISAMLVAGLESKKNPQKPNKNLLTDSISSPSNSLSTFSLDQQLHQIDTSVVVLYSTSGELLTDNLLLKNT